MDSFEERAEVGWRSLEASGEVPCFDLPIILVSFRNAEDRYPPFGILYVADALIQSGFRVILFHEPSESMPGLLEMFGRERTLFVGFSTITGPLLTPTIEASRAAKKLGHIVVWGGVHATIMPLEVLQEDYVDFVVVNEGEETVQQLALELSGRGGLKWPEIKGLAFRRDGNPTLTPERPFLSDLDRFQPRWELLDVESYLIPSGFYARSLPVCISRGCPFRCGFCYNLAVMRRTWRQHSDAFIVEQVRYLQETYGIDAVDYADDYLFGRVRPMQRLIEKVGLPWSGQVRVQLLDQDFVRWMRATNCQWVNIGAESGSQRILDMMTKDQKADQIKWGLTNLVEGAAEVEANVSFLVGIPGETRAERAETLALCKELCQLSEQVRCSVCWYVPYPGTPLWPAALRAGFSAPVCQVGWAECNLDRGNVPWVDDSEARAIVDINRILFVGRSRGHWTLSPYYALLRWRWRHRFFSFYWEGRLRSRLERSPFGAILSWMTRHLVRFDSRTHRGANSTASAPGRDRGGFEEAQ